MQNNSLVKKNMILNIFRTLLSVFFPLITYPYATRVLGVSNFGKINYTNSIIGYISLIGSLGFASYAIREGGIFRNNKKKFSKFSQEIYSLNILSTVLAYIVLIILLFVNVKLQSNELLLMIQSLSILFTTIGVDWINVIYEDYSYITIRSFIVQLFFTFCLFLFVKNSEDYILYSILQVSINVIIAILNRIHVRKYCNLRFTLNLNIKRHFIPIFVLFSNQIAVSIYVNLDSVMIGSMRSEYEVGLYSVPVKIYTIAKQLMSAMYSVTVTRLTEYADSKENDKYQELLNDIFSTIMSFIIPVSIGLFCCSDLLVVLIGGKEYVDSTNCLRILSITIFFAVIGGAIAYCVFLPNKKEKINLVATCISAVENVALNAFVIPRYGIDGAAFTTLLSEISVVIILILNLRKFIWYFDFKRIAFVILKSYIASVPIIIISNFIKYFEITYIMKLIFIMFVSIAVFFSLSILLKNESIIQMYTMIIKRKKNIL